jgi:SCY1-like protein 1
MEARRSGRYKLHEGRRGRHLRSYKHARCMLIHTKHITQTYGSLTPDSGRYAPPEVAKGGWDSIKKGPVSAVDSYAFAILIIEVFNGSFSASDQVGQTKGIPVNMHASYKRLAHANPKTRLSVAHFLEQGRKSGSFFDTPLIQLTDGIENLGLKTETEREEFIR